MNEKNGSINPSATTRIIIGAAPPTSPLTNIPTRRRSARADIGILQSITANAGRTNKISVCQKDDVSRGSRPNGRRGAPGGGPGAGRGGGRGGGGERTT